MLYPSIATLLENIENRYSLVILTAKRARQIATEAERSNVHLEDKPVKMAIGEIAAGKIRIRKIEDSENDCGI